MSSGENISEYRRFLETLRALGIEFSFDYLPPAHIWQKHLFAAGFNLTAFGCNAIIVGDVEYLFATGHAEGRRFSPKVESPAGVYLMQRNVKTGKVTPRKYFDEKKNVFVGSGLEALGMCYA